jgi:cell division protein FtsI/penicillin-binding protein 2
MIPTRAHRIRMIVIASVLVVAMCALGYRIYVLQILRNAELTQAVARMHDRKIKLPARRGMILDCNQNVLANSVPVRTIVIDPQAIRDEEIRRTKLKQPILTSDLIQILSSQLLISKNEVQEKLKASGRYVVLRKKIPEDVARLIQDQISQKKIRGVIFEDDQIRSYPNGSLMSHVVGFVNSEQLGMDGVESVMQTDLQGQEGWMKIVCDSRGRELVPFRKDEFPARDGYNVVLTLDQAVQNIVEQELDKGISQYHPDSAVVIVMRPATGEILALANRPTYDPSSSEKQISAMKNRAVADLIEPGSTFKIVTIATALDQRIISLDDSFWCENGRFLYEGRYINDHEPLGNLNVTGILVHSSNIGAAKIALMLGNEKMYNGMWNFGFGQKAFGDSPSDRWQGEVRGILRPLRSWSKVSITHVAMGYEVGVTPLQMVTAMSALANGGDLMRPQIVKSVQKQDGTIVREFFPQVRRRVVDRKAAREITTALTQVVTKEGTAAKAAIPGFVVAGKTGTAHKVVNGQYAEKQYVSSFCGYFPAKQPELCVYVMFDNPKGKDYFGGAVAAPIFKTIGQRVASYMSIKPTRNTTAETSVARMAAVEVVR